MNLVPGVLFGKGNTLLFTVPAGATIGQTTMRVRISYQPDDGAINPCGTSTYGEVEDYVIDIQQAQQNS